MQALLASLEPVRLEGDALVVRGPAYDLRLVEQRTGELVRLASRARQRETTIVAEAAEAEATGEVQASPGKTVQEAAMDIPLVRQAAELFDGQVVRAIRRPDAGR